MNKPREKHLQEMADIREALKKTKSPYAKRDLTKALARKRRELKEYDEWIKSDLRKQAE